MSPTDEMLDAGIGSSSGLNFGQLSDFSKDFYNPLDKMIRSTGGINIELGLSNKSTGHDSHGSGSPREDNEQDGSPNIKKRYKRHTKEQLQQLEAFFEKSPQPDENQRRDMARELELDPLQIKFWFQNKRTQMKVRSHKQSTTFLQNEYEKLRDENKKLNEAHNNAHLSLCISSSARKELLCEKCQLSMENSQLREKLEELREQVAIAKGKPPMLNLIDVTPPVTPLEPCHHHLPGFGDTFGPVNLFVPANGITNVDNKEMIVGLVRSAMDEFVIMAQTNSPLWLLEETNSSLVLNEMEYSRVFSKTIWPRPTGFRPEASKDSAVFKMSSNDLVRILMDERRWSMLFSEIVARITTLEVLSTGDQETYHDALHLMNAEFQALSPLARSRESCFLRHCWNHYDGSWTVVDFSVEGDWLSNNTSVRCKRKPSGCLIEDMPNGYSKVTWVEHVEVDDQEDPHLYTLFIHSDPAFGAKRWISILKRHCDLLASIKEPNLASIYKYAISP